MESFLKILVNDTVKDCKIVYIDDVYVYVSYLENDNIDVEQIQLSELKDMLVV